MFEGQPEGRDRSPSGGADQASPAAGRPRSDGVPPGPRFIDAREVVVRTPPEKAFEPIRRIGGATGWYCADWLWRLRAAMNVLVGGVGMRGRKDPERLGVGDPVDFWRVEAVEAGRRLRLALELRIPGRGWLEFEVSPDGVGTVIRQRATFEPCGLLGRMYWWAAYPFHALVFAGMLRGIAARTEGSARGR